MPPASRWLIAAFVALGLGVASPSAEAASCADFANQAAAQRAANTRDGDGDGRYCESLPCPCAGTPTTRSPVRAPTHPKVGEPVLLGRRLKNSGCEVRGPLPDPRCTPGSRFPLATPKLFCTSGYSAGVRDVGADVKRRVFAAYGITRHVSGQYEIDHLVPLELGGSNSIANLFPEAVAGARGFRQKDHLEDVTHSRACAGRGDWRAAQRAIAKDWVALYADLIPS